MTTVFSNIDNQAAVGPVHALAPGTWLSCVHPAISQEPHAGTTADQIAAQHIGQDTPLPSLEVATDNRGGGGFCDRDYGCSYAGTISFRTPTTPLPMETDPRKLFIRLFGQGDNAGRARALVEAVRVAARHGRREKPTTCSARSGRPTRRMLSDYLESVREIERRIQKMEARDLSKVDIPDAPGTRPLAVRSAHQPDVRSGGAGVSGQHDARLHLHDGGGSQRPDLQPHRRARRVPSALASQQRAGARWTAW